MFKISKEDIKALKQAKRVVYRVREGKETIEFYKPVNDKKTNDLYTFNGDEMEYKLEREKVFDFNLNCFYMDIMGISQSIAYILKEGDEVRLEWAYNGSTNNLMKERGLFGDTLYMIVHRKQGKKIIPLRFMIGQTTTLDNECKMIRKTR